MQVGICRAKSGDWIACGGAEVHRYAVGEYEQFSLKRGRNDVFRVLCHVELHHTPFPQIERVVLRISDNACTDVVAAPPVQFDLSGIAVNHHKEIVKPE